MLMSSGYTFTSVTDLVIPVRYNTDCHILYFCKELEFVCVLPIVNDIGIFNSMHSF